ncbi:MAG: RecQ family ATP-dependent DNA helicase [Candidatus Goldiibacteriota bacterium]
MAPITVLKETFGYENFRPGQKELIDNMLAGRDSIGIMPTGAGKSITFQIPARLMKGTVLVISPLISLMKDQVDALDQYGFRAVFINSSLDPAGKAERLSKFKKGEYELVYLAPEALDAGIGEFLENYPIAMVVVDEAHCISHWGHDFRPAYRRLAGLKKRLGNIPVLALTATATSRVVEDIGRQLGMKSPDIYRGSFYRPNLKIAFRKKGKGVDVKRFALQYARSHKGQSGIVYCWSRKRVEGFAEYLKKNGIKAVSYHAGLAPAQRDKHQDMFLKDDVDVVVATIAFGMGINKSNVRYIIHADMPKTTEGFYQEIGRAGRDGLDSDCIMFYSWVDVMNYDFFLKDMEDEEVKEEFRQKTKDMFRLADRNTCRHREVVKYFGENMNNCGASCDKCRGIEAEQLIENKEEAVKSVLNTDKTGSPRDMERVSGGKENFDAELFGELKVLRRKMAQEQGLPPYIIFSDKTLKLIAGAMPQTNEEFLEINGVGRAKLEKYGKAFMDKIKQVYGPEPERETGKEDCVIPPLNTERLETLAEKYASIPNLKHNTDMIPEYISKEREKYSRAYEAWSAPEDRDFIQAYERTDNIKELCRIFQRNPGAIKARIKKLELE